MAHIQEPNSKLWHPESTHEKVDSQKMFVLNIEQLELLFTNLVNGTLKVGDTNKLGGNSSSYFATASSVTNITNGTTKVGLTRGIDIVSVSADETLATIVTGTPSGQVRCYRYSTQLPSDFPTAYLAGTPSSQTSTLITVANCANIMRITIEGSYGQATGGAGSQVKHTPFIIIGTYDPVYYEFSWRNISDGTTPASTNVVNATVEE